MSVIKPGSTANTLSTFESGLQLNGGTAGAKKIVYDSGNTRVDINNGRLVIPNAGTGYNQSFGRQFSIISTEDAAGCYLRVDNDTNNTGSGKKWLIGEPVTPGTFSIYNESDPLEVFKITPTGAVTVGPGSGGIRHYLNGSLILDRQSGGGGAGSGFVSATASIALSVNVTNYNNDNRYLSTNRAAALIMSRASSDSSEILGLYPAVSGTEGNAATFSAAVLSVTHAGAWTLGPSGFASPHAANTNEFRIQRTSNATISIGNSGDLGYFSVVGIGNTTAGYYQFFQQTNDKTTKNLMTLQSSVDGAWTIGPSSSTVKLRHLITGFNDVDADSCLLVQNKITVGDTATNYDDCSTIECTKPSTTNSTSQRFMRFSLNNGSTLSGYITANGAGVAPVFSTTSDRRIKQNIRPLTGVLSQLLRLKPSVFDREDIGATDIIGQIAQDVQEVFPEDVGIDKNGMLSLGGWGRTETRLLAAIQELNAKIEAQQEEINLLKAAS